MLRRCDRAWASPLGSAPVVILFALVVIASEACSFIGFGLEAAGCGLPVATLEGALVGGGQGLACCLLPEGFCYPLFHTFHTHRVTQLYGAVKSVDESLEIFRKLS
jgi:hypothetical protein